MKPLKGKKLIIVKLASAALQGKSVAVLSSIPTKAQTKWLKSCGFSVWANAVGWDGRRNKSLTRRINIAILRGQI